MHLICDAEAEIPAIIHQLTQGSPSIQQKTLEHYFTPDAAFIHPFCRKSRGPYPRLLILAIYRWYRILSPNIELEVNSVGPSPGSGHDPSGMPRLTSGSLAFDPQNLILYVSIHQVFSLAVIPFHRADVALTTVLHLTTEKSSETSDPSSPLMPYSETLPPTKESQHLLYAQPTIYLIAK